MGFYELLKDLGHLAQQLNNAAITKATAELKLEGAQLMSEKAELTERAAKLLEENARLREQLSLRDALVFEENVYWKNTSSDQREGPFCPACFDDKGKAIRMQDERDEFIDDFYECTVCHYRAIDPHGTPKKDPNRLRRQDYF